MSYHFVLVNINLPVECLISIFYLNLLQVQLWSLIAITSTVGLPSSLVLEISDLQLQFFLSVECAGIWCLRIVLAPLHHSHHPDMILPLHWRIVVINGHNILYVVLPFHSILIAILHYWCLIISLQPNASSCHTCNSFQMKVNIQFGIHFSCALASIEVKACQATIVMASSTSSMIILSPFWSHGCLT